MDDKNKWPSIPLAITWGALIIVGIIALGWALPPIIMSIGTAIGLAISIGATGLIAGGAMAWWIAPAAAAGLGATGTGVTILVLVKAARKATKEPFEWAIALLSLGGSALADVAREFAVTNILGKVLVTTLVAFFLVVASACYNRGGPVWCATGVVLFLVVPAIILSQNLNIQEVGTISESFRHITPSVWIRMLGLGVVGAIIVVLHKLTEARHA